MMDKATNLRNAQSAQFSVSFVSNYTYIQNITTEAKILITFWVLYRYPICFNIFNKCHDNFEIKMDKLQK